MNALKDKVSNQLSKLFADSSNPLSSPPPSPSSPSPDNPPPARSYSKGGKTVSSYFSLFLPSVSFSGSRSNTRQGNLRSVRSLPVGWGGKDFKEQDECSVGYHRCNTTSNDKEYRKLGIDYKESSAVSENMQNVNSPHSNEDGGSGKRSDSDVFEEAREQQTPRKSSTLLMDESVFITSELYEFLQSSLPNIVKGRQWVMLYSTMKHGISLRTLLRKSADLSGPCLLIVGDRQGAVFGGLLECPLKPTAKRKYQGTNQSFVFTTLYGEPRLFRPTGANRYYYLCLNDLLALGGGGNFALCLDGDLLNGTSGPCDTFGNACLAHKPEFELKNVELWGFTHLSKYRSC